MENSNKQKTGLAAILLGVGFAAAAMVGIYQYQNAQEAEKSLAASEEKALDLSSQKTELEDEVATLSAELEAKIKESEEAAAALKEMEEKRVANNKAYSFRAKQAREKLEAEQLQRQMEIDSLNAQLTELTAIKDQMAEDLKVVPILEAENSDLKAEVQAWEMKYAKLEADFNDLSDRYQKLIYDAPADNFKIEVTDRRDKLTSKAKRAKKVTVSFLMPEFLMKEMKGKETLYLSLFNEKIEPLPGYINEVSINRSNGTIPVAVHATEIYDPKNGPEIVSFEVELSEDLEEGFYKGKVYSANNYYGTIDFRLR
ncbi:hypothetical protein [Jiulongibacter sediminis]|jgi:cell division protein FtsB|uniref:hypothetical protein n=1 Tax=Jiulongibacter sediminis TaxID=1605367 RepID=UPI0026EA6C9C|nr:hypothetical protein [Jiulongibacter sediminis]